MSKLPKHWGRLVRTAGLIVSVAAVGIWSTGNRVAAAVLFTSGVVVMAVRPHTMLERPRMWKRALVFIGAVSCVSAVPLWTELHPLVAVAAVAVGLILVGLGSLLVPSIETGAHVAKSMENTWLGGEVVVPPRSLIDRSRD